MSPRPESVIFIDKQLVWMTCGVEVGYQVLLAPRTSGVEWLSKHFHTLKLVASNYAPPK